MAEINGTAELSQTTTDFESTDASGQGSSTRQNTFFQRYRLNYNELLYPNLNLTVGGYTDKAISTTNGPGGDTRATDTVIMPSASLSLSSPFVHSGVGFSRREEKVEAGGGPPVTDIFDRKNAFLGFRPEGLPSLEMQAERSHIFDKAHEAIDTKNDSFSASTRFTPVQNLDLAYTVNLNNSKNLLSGVESDTVSENGRVSYSHQFLDNRVGFTANYNRFQSSTETQLANGGGEVAFQLFAFTGLSNISDTPTLDVLSPNQALLDGNLSASSGINIGQGVSLSGDTRLREVGLDFVNATDVNTLYIYVDRQLPASVANTVAWDIYVSSDNQNWVPFQTGLHGAFNPFTNRFELLFPDVTTRYIKAATRPLAVTVLPPPGTDISNVFITELQSFIRKSSAQVTTRKSQQTNQLFDASVRTAILENQLLTHTFFYSQAKSSGGSTNTFLSNTLSSAKRFSAVFSGMASVGRNDTTDPSGSSVDYSGTASLTAVPLPTLYHSLVLSAHQREENGQTNSNESVFLNNSAALYRGIDLNLSGGVNFATASTGSKNTSRLINTGLNLVPNKSLSMSVNHSETQSDQSVGASNRSSNTTGGIAWVPCATVYLAYSISRATATNVPSQTSQSYSASWSPFSSGALNFTASYSEIVQSQFETTDRALTFAATWRVGPRIILSSGYTVTKSSAPSQTEEAKSLTTDLMMSF